MAGKSGANQSAEASATATLVLWVVDPLVPVIERLKRP